MKKHEEIFEQMPEELKRAARLIHENLTASNRFKLGGSGMYIADLMQVLRPDWDVSQIYRPTNREDARLGLEQLRNYVLSHPVLKSRYVESTPPNIVYMEGKENY